MRKSEVTRKTNETNITLSLSIDGTGQAEINTGSGFFDHMLTLFTRYSRFDLSVSCIGDTAVDYHHSIEDIGIALGTAFKDAVGDKMGISRFSDVMLPMDESLILCAVDISGRAYCHFDLPVSSEKIGEYDTELTEEFFRAFLNNAGVTLHIKKLHGTNSHHITEAAFKAFGMVMRKACKIDNDFSREIPSTKGIL